VIYFDLQVVCADAGRDPYFLKMDNLLFFPGFSFSLCLFVLELGEIDDLAYRRSRVGRDLNQVFTSFPGER
jgi:hypothetical protein